MSAASRPLSEDDLADLERASRRANALRGITGLLLYADQRFFAVVEGPRRRVLRRMEAIAQDPRHRQLVVLSEERIEAPRFGNWSLAVMPGRSGMSASDPFESFILGLAGRL